MIFKVQRQNGAINGGKTTCLIYSRQCSRIQDKDKIKKQVKVKAGKIKRCLKNKKIGLKSKFFFNIFRMTQKNGWNKTDSDYWRDKGWLNGEKPY